MKKILLAVFSVLSLFTISKVNAKGRVIVIDGGQEIETNEVVINGNGDYVYPSSLPSGYIRDNDSEYRTDIITTTYEDKYNAYMNSLDFKIRQELLLFRKMIREIDKANIQCIYVDEAKYLELRKNGMAMEEAYVQSFVFDKNIFEDWLNQHKGELQDEITAVYNEYCVNEDGTISEVCG